MNEKEYENDTKLLDELYKNVRMGTFAIDCIINAIENPELEKLLRKQNEIYLAETKTIESLSDNYKHTPVDINIFLKGTSFASIKMKTMMDNDTSHLAQMLVEGTTMGITNTLKAKSENKCNDDKILEMANKIIASQEKFVESLKDFI